MHQQRSDPDQPTGDRPAAGEGARVVRQAVELLMHRRRLTRADALARLHGIAAEVGIELREAASLVLALDEP